ncbi:MAG TPA: hypothetical protein VLD86_03660 [Ilumatobacteraceae bacterium]|nr:hypothetical protein [Ilumatobacteraceae bacterium]
MNEIVLHHFSESPSIARFVPHVPRTNPEHRRAVWAIDAEHAPLYWFPRDCPRVAIWPLRPDDLAMFQHRFATSAPRIHAIESGWLERMRAAQLYRYDFDPHDFYPWDEADGQWISEREVVPLRVEPVGDLLAAHAAAGIELRVVPSLWPLHDIARRGEFDFSIVRMHNARPRD